MKIWIYTITNCVDGRRYVGQTRRPVERVKEHKRYAAHGGTHYIHNAIRKHGIQNFRFEFLPDFATTQQEADTRERRMIRDLGTLAPNGYNILRGGQSSAAARRNPRTAGLRYEIARTIRGIREARDRERKAQRTARRRELLDARLIRELDRVMRRLGNPDREMARGRLRERKLDELRWERLRLAVGRLIMSASTPARVGRPQTKVLRLAR